MLDLFNIVVTALFTDAAKVGKKARLRTLRDLDAAALQLRRAGGALMDDAVEDGAVRGAALAIVPRAMPAAALEQIDAIVQPPAISASSNFAPRPASCASCCHAKVRLSRLHAGRTAKA